MFEYNHLETHFGIYIYLHLQLNREPYCNVYATFWQGDLLTGILASLNENVWYRLGGLCKEKSPHISYIIYQSISYYFTNRDTTKIWRIDKLFQTAVPIFTETAGPSNWETAPLTHSM